MARKRRRSPRRKKSNLMLHRTRNLGVIGTRGAGVIAHTVGPFISDSEIIDMIVLKTESNQPIVNESRSAQMIPEIT